MGSYDWCLNLLGGVDISSFKEIGEPLSGDWDNSYVTPLFNDTGHAG